MCSTAEEVKWTRSELKGAKYKKSIVWSQKRSPVAGLLTLTLMEQSSSSLVKSVLTNDISKVDETDRQIAQRMVLRLELL